MNAEASLTETPATPTEAGADDGIAKLGDLLLASEPTTAGAEQDDEQSQRGSDTSNKAETATLSRFNDLAGATGIDLDDLYALEVVTSEDGEPVTIQSLKDSYASVQQDKLDRIEWEETRAAEQRKLLQESAELREIMASLPPGAVNDKALAKIRERSQAAIDFQNSETLRVIPEWQHPEKREADLKGIASHLQEYGLPVDFLKNVTDHRLRKYMRDMWQLQNRVNDAIAQVKKAKPVKQPVSRNADKAKGPALTRETGGLKALKTVT